MTTRAAPPPARVQADDAARLILTRRGAEIAAALQTLGLELLRRRAGGYVPLPADVAEVVRMTRRAAGSVDGTATGRNGDAVSSSPRVLSCGDHPLDTRTAAEVIGVSTRAVRKACVSGRLAAVRVSGVWMIDAESAQRFAAQRESG